MKSRLFRFATNLYQNNIRHKEMAQQPDTVASDHRLRRPPPTKSPITLSIELTMNNEDLLTEILLRLPAKSLSRFKSVCKKWLSLISSDYLCNHHTLRGPKLQPSLILQDPFYPRKFFYFNGEKTIIHYSNFPQHDIVQACNGLMLLKLSRIYDPTTKQFQRLRKSSYYVYNPTTRRSREIIPTHNKEYPHVVAMGLTFDPSKSPYYNIVCIRSTAKKDYLEIEVYDSKSHTWKVSLEAINYSSTIYSRGVYWNNAIYWRSEEEGYCCFDIGKNEMKTLSFPQTPNNIGEGRRTYFYFFLQESNGHLHLFKWISERVKDKDRAKSVAVWELGGNDDDHSNSQWLFKYHHPLGKRIKTNLLRLTVGSDVGDELLFYQNGKMRAYNFIDKLV